MNLKRGIVVGQMLTVGKELIRISPKDARKIEYSDNGGRVWRIRYIGLSATGEFQDLKGSGKELRALTSKGVFYSQNAGRSWIFRGY